MNILESFIILLGLSVTLLVIPSKLKRPKTTIIFAFIMTLLVWGLTTLGEMPFIWQVFTDLFAAIPLLGFQWILIADSVSNTYSPYRHGDGRQSKPIVSGAMLAMIFMVVLLLITIYVPIWSWGTQGQVSNANYLNGQLKYEPSGALFANETLPISAVPLVGEPYAQQIAQSHLSADFGGSSQIVDQEQIVYHNEPYWAFTVSSTNTLSQNYEKGFVLVNAVNASYFEVKQQTTIGPGLCGVCLSSIDIQTYLKNTDYSIGNWYPQPLSNGQVLYVQTLDQPQFSGQTTFAGGIVYNADGTINATYNNIKDAPSFVNQPWDRELLTQEAGQWANTRNGNGSFSIWAGGFITISASSDRLQLDSDGSNNYQLIPYHDSTAVMLFFSPANAQRSLSGIMVATGPNLYYYDMSALNLISPTYAQSQVQSQLPTRAGGAMSTANPILYPVNGQFVYIIPYFFTDDSSGNILFQGVGVVGSTQSGQAVVVAGTNITSTRDQALSEYFNGNINTNTSSVSTTVSGPILKDSTYSLSGNTIIALDVNGAWYTASPPNPDAPTSTISYNDWNTLQQAQVGQNISLTVRGTSIIGIAT